MKRLTKAVKSAGRVLYRLVDLNDVMFWGGLLALWFGCWAVYEPSAWIVCGVVLLSVGLYGATRKPEG